MKDIFWEIDPVNGDSYSLFEEKRKAKHPPISFCPPNYQGLRQQLLDHFHGMIIPVCILEEYILEETSFCAGGYKEHVLKPLEQTGRLIVTPSDRLRTLGEYAESDLLHFL